MNSFRIARAAFRGHISAIRKPLQRRGYADAVSDKIKLTLALPHQVSHPRRIDQSSMNAFLDGVLLAIYISVR